MKAHHVRFGYFGFRAVTNAGPFPDKSIPIGMKYILAILCSNPEATKAIIGKKHEKILPIVFSAEITIHTAKHTSILHNIPLKNASYQVKFTFALAIPTAADPS